MTDPDPAVALWETAGDSPDAVDLDVLADRLSTAGDEERPEYAAVLGRLALAGRDVSAAVDAAAFETWDETLFEPSIWIHPVPDDDEEAIVPRAVAFAVCSLVVTDHAEPEALSWLLDVHGHQYPEFDAEMRRYTVVREVGWALASTVILTDDYVDRLVALTDHDGRAVRRVAAAGLSDVAEEYHSVHGRPAPQREALLDHAADLLAGRDDERVRYHAAFTLYEFGMEDPTLLATRLPLLRGALDDPYYLVRKEAAGMLGLVGDEGAVEALSRLADSDPSEEVRTKAADALESIREGQ